MRDHVCHFVECNLFDHLTNVQQWKLSQFLKQVISEYQKIMVTIMHGRVVQCSAQNAVSEGIIPLDRDATKGEREREKEERKETSALPVTFKLLPLGHRYRLHELQNEFRFLVNKGSHKSCISGYCHVLFVIEA